MTALSASFGRGSESCGAATIGSGWYRIPVCLLWLALPLFAQDKDPILQAMRDELNRSRELRVLNLEAPYYIEYSLEDATTFHAGATLGGILASRQERYRVPRIRVRVGDYKFDNTNYAGGFGFGSQYDTGRFPLDDVYSVLRRYLWLSTDSSYKAALETISRKRAALKNVSVTDQLNDFAKAEPAKYHETVEHPRFDPEGWTARARALSAVFRGYPDLRGSAVDIQAVHSIRYFINSEGADVRDQEKLMLIRARASAQAPDGTIMRDAVTLHSLDFAGLPPEQEATREMARVAGNVVALAHAPRAETYSGPVLFEGMAAPQLIAEVLGRNFTLTRRPVTDQGRGGQMQTSELEGRQGARILPEWMDVVDDPTRPMFAHTAVDNEGVAAKSVTLVEKGILKNFLLTRQPVRGFEGSNGHARLPGNFGANAATISNLIVTAKETVSKSALKQKLVEMVQSRNKPFGIIVRKMDFPSTLR